MSEEDRYIANYSKKTEIERDATGDRRKKLDDEKQLFTLNVLDRTAPKYLDKIASAFWKENIENLINSRILKATDLKILELASIAYSEMRYWENRVRVLRLDAKLDPDQEVKVTNMLMRAIKEFTNLSSKLGATPVDRSRVINTSSETDENDMAEYD